MRCLRWLLFGSLFAGCAGPRAVGATALVAPMGAGRVTVVQASEVEWEALNPARGDKSPRAATLWGDRNASGPTGFLVRFSDGFSSPPHIHNVSYRGVVLRGLVHNDDPNADDQWMPVGSFWTQPKGAAHVTAAMGSDVLAYIEIEEGPYLVHPVDQAFDMDEVPINVDTSNLVWLDAPGMTRSEVAQIAYLWGEPGTRALNGTLIRLPAGFDGELRAYGPSFRAVVVEGRIRHEAIARGAANLEPGSLFESEDAVAHRVACGDGSACVVYVRAEGEFEVVADP